MLRILPFYVLLLISTTLNAQSPTIFDSLYALSFHQIELEVDLDSLIESKFTEIEHTANMKIISADSVVLELPLKVSVRSKSRRRYCDFPPLKFNFVKSDLESLGLAREDEYKIVTHCLTDKSGEEGLIKEFMIYQLYRLVTPLSLRAKLFDIVYVDSKSGNRETQKAILLESEKEFAKNQQATLCNCMGTTSDSVNALQFELLAMFQYMIGNEDMDHRVERNVKFIMPDDGTLWLPFAYDFDFSAIVNAPYVHPKIKDNAVIRRKYLGFRENQEYLPEVMQILEAKKKPMIDFIKDFDLISKGERRRSIDYIEKFYQEVSDKKLVFEYKDY